MPDTKKPEPEKNSPEFFREQTNQLLITHTNALGELYIAGFESNKQEMAKKAAQDICANKGFTCDTNKEVNTLLKKYDRATNEVLGFIPSNAWDVSWNTTNAAKQALNKILPKDKALPLIHEPPSHGLTCFPKASTFREVNNCSKPKQAPPTRG